MVPIQIYKYPHKHILNGEWSFERQMCFAITIKPQPCNNFQEVKPKEVHFSNEPEYNIVVSYNQSEFFSNEKNWTAKNKEAFSYPYPIYFERI